MEGCGGRGAGIAVVSGVPTALIYSCNIFRSSRAAEIYIRAREVGAHTSV